MSTEEAARLNHMAHCGCDGFLIADAATIAAELIALLRSDHEIGRETRRALADALERGRGNSRAVTFNAEGQEMPRIVIVGLGWNGKFSTAVGVRRNWLEAARTYWDRVQDGEQPSGSLKCAVGAAFGLDDEAMKKVLRFYKRFIEEFTVEDSALRKEAAAIIGSPEPCGASDSETYYHDLEGLGGAVEVTP